MLENVGNFSEYENRSSVLSPIHIQSDACRSKSGTPYFRNIFTPIQLGTGEYGIGEEFNDDYAVFVPLRKLESNPIQLMPIS